MVFCLKEGRKSFYSPKLGVGSRQKQLQVDGAEMREGLTLAPLSAVGVQVVWVKPLRLVQAIQNFPDVHHLNQTSTKRETLRLRTPGTDLALCIARPFTFCANSGFPESLLRCMNSKCRVPYSARMLLPPDAHGQFLPMPLKKEKRKKKTGRRMLKEK